MELKSLSKYFPMMLNKHQQLSHMIISNKVSLQSTVAHLNQANTLLKALSCLLK